MTQLLSIVVVALTASLGACAPQQEPAVDPGVKLVTVETLASKPAEYVDRAVRVRGRLENAGTNYFRNRRIVLSDGKNHLIDVRPWLPLSVPPSPAAQTESRPTLAEYLDRQVELVGSLAKVEKQQAGNEYIFAVTSAKILTPQGEPVSRLTDRLRHEDR
jgi:hypothetical protein